MDFAELVSLLFLGVMILSGGLTIGVILLDAWTTVSSAKRRPDPSPEDSRSEVPEDPRERVPRAWRQRQESPSIKDIYGDGQDK